MQNQTTAYLLFRIEDARGFDDADYKCLYFAPNEISMQNGWVVLNAVK